MMVKTLCKLVLLLSLASCTPVGVNSSTALTTKTLVPSFTASPIPIVPTDTSLIAPPVSSTVTPNPGAKNIDNYYGVWTITRYEHARMSMRLTDEYAESQIGKTMELGNSKISFDQDFLWLGNQHCANASYAWVTPDEFTGHAWQILLPNGNPEQRDEFLFLNVRCDGNGLAGFEVSRSGKLIAYYDSYWFFLDPETGAASALATRFATTYTPTSPPSPLPRFTATYTASLAPTQYYEKYFGDWLVDQQAEAHRGHILQAGSEPLLVFETYPEAPESYLDLDLSMYTEGMSDLKFAFVKGTPPAYQLLPVNGTKIIPVDYSHASFETCMNTSYSSSLKSILIETEQGSYFCAVTSDRRFSLFHIDEVNPLGSGSLRISFVTYAKDTDK
jgi:hypothetical protein